MKYNGWYWNEKEATIGFWLQDLITSPGWYTLMYAESSIHEYSYCLPISVIAHLGAEADRGEMLLQEKRLYECNTISCYIQC